MKLAKSLALSLSALWMACGPLPAPASNTPAPAPLAPAPVAAADGTTPAAPAADPAATTPGPQMTAKGVRFNYRPQGKPGEIFLAGNFNGWDPSNSSFLLKDEDGDGMYSITVPLAAGTYQYKYVVDGTWTKDPHSPAQTDDGFGGLNGKFVVP